MTRSPRHKMPTQTSVKSDQPNLSPRVEQERLELKEKKPRDNLDLPWGLDVPCRECQSVEIPCEGLTWDQRCTPCGLLGYACHRLRDGPTVDMVTAEMANLQQSAPVDALLPSDRSSAPQACRKEKSSPVDVKSYIQPFLSFISENPTTFHAVATVCRKLESHGFTSLSERDSWTNKLSRGGKYCFTRNGSSVIAFVVGDKYEPGNGVSVIATHIDALTTRVKPIPTLSTKAGYLQLGVAPYAGALNNTWWDRDLGIGGRVLVKDSKTGKIETKLVKLGWPIARIPTLAPHFGAAADLSHPNKETEMVPIIGLDCASSNGNASDKQQTPNVLGGAGTFTATQPERLVKAIAGEMNIQDCKWVLFSFSSHR